MQHSNWLGVQGEGEAAPPQAFFHFRVRLQYGLSQRQNQALLKWRDHSKVVVDDCLSGRRIYFAGIRIHSANQDQGYYRDRIQEKEAALPKVSL